MSNSREVFVDCDQCHGTGREYPNGHEGDDDWLQQCGACNGTGEQVRTIPEDR